MTDHITRRAKMLALALLIAIVPVATVASPPATLPTLEADSLGGHHVKLPDDAAGMPIVLIVGYDRSAEKSLTLWSHALVKSMGTRARIYAVVDAAGAPFFVHGLIKHQVAKDAPDAQVEHRSNILVTFSKGAWNDIAPTGHAEDAAVIIVDASGHIVAAKRDPYSESGAAEAAKAVP